MGFQVSRTLLGKWCLVKDNITNWWEWRLSRMCSPSVACKIVSSGRDNRALRLSQTWAQMLVPPLSSRSRRTNPFTSPGLHFFFSDYLSVFDCAGSLAAHGLFSTCGEQGLPSSCGVQASHRRVSSVAEQGLWGARASVVVACGLRGCGSWYLEHRLSICGPWA